MKRFIVQKGIGWTIRFLVAAAVILVVASYFVDFRTFAGTFFGVTISSNSDLKNGLVGHWTFDGKDLVLNATDRSGEGNDGALRGFTSTTTRAGRIGQSLDFDANGNRVQLNGDYFGDLSTFTVSLWIYPETQGEGNWGQFFSSSQVCGDGTPLTEGWSFGFYGGSGARGEVCFEVDFDSTNVEVITDQDEFTLNEWQHVVLTWDGSTTAANVHIYRNDEEVSYATQINGSGSRVDDLGNSNIGNNVSANSTFDGRIDDVRVYSRVLSDNERSHLYELGAANRVNTTLTSNSELHNGLLGHWTFDGPDMVGGVLDISGQGNNGTTSVSVVETDGVLGQAIDLSGVKRASTFSREQSDVASGNPASATFGSTPTNGNLLVATAIERSGTSEADFTITGSGWTKRVGHDAELGDSNARRTLVVWTKTAGASEPTNIQVDNGTANTIKLMIQEFAANSSVTWNFETATSGDTGTGASSPLSTESTDSVSAEDLFVMTAAGWRNGVGGPSSISWTNDQGDILNSIDGSDGRSISSAYDNVDTASGTKESSVSWSGSDHEASAAILVHSVSGADWESGLDLGNVGSGVQTIAFWAKVATSTTNKFLFDIDGTDHIETNGSDEVVATSFPAATVYINGSTATTAIDTNWNHVVVTDTTGVNASALGSGTADEVFFGSLDDVRVYDRVLSAEEIERLYELGATTHINTTIASNPDNEDGLVGHWTFDGKMTGVATATVFTDTFTEASTHTNLDLHSPDRGLGYTQIIDIGDCDIAVDFGDDVFGDGEDPNCGTSQGALYATNDVMQLPDVEVTVDCTDCDNFDEYNWLACRIQDSSNFYAAQFNGSDSQIHLVDGGVFSHLGASAAGIADGSVATLSCQGDTISLIDDGATIRSVTDGTHRGAGQVGIGMGDLEGGTDDVVNQALDNLSVVADVPAPQDASGNANHGIATAVAASGKIGQGLSFDGVDDSVEVVSSSSLNPTSAVTVAGWVKFSDVSGRQDIIGKWGDTNGERQYLLIMHAPGGGGEAQKIQFWVGYDSGGTLNQTTPGATTMETSTWYHIAGVYDGSDIIYYLNGEEESSKNIGSQTLNSDSSFLGIGNIEDTAGEATSGVIDDVRVYNQALAPNEIKRLYELGR